MSSDDVVVEARGLGKCYEIYASPPDRLKQMVVPPLAAALARFRGATPGPTRYYREFWALRDIDVQVRRGETLAIVGRNGSGKSTLLQIVAGTMSPTTGTIRTSGRIAALLELGSGFNVEFSGRDNIYLNCAILGIPRDEVDRRLDSILAFADIGDFIDEPVKTYSSGMMVRLAFAVQANVDADIVIIDEALAVGDVFFAQKCFGRLRSLVDSGAAVIFVTHDLGTVTQFCRRALVLHHGREYFHGDPVTAIRRYLSIERSVPPAAAPTGGSAKAPAPADKPPAGWPPAGALAAGPQVDVVGSGKAQFMGAGIFDESGEPAEIFEIGQPAWFCYDFRLLEPVGVPVGGLSIVNEKNVIVHGKNSLQTGLGFDGVPPAGALLRFRQRVRLDLTPGEYTIVIGLATVDGDALAHLDHLSHDQLGSRTERVASVGGAGRFRVVYRREGLALTHHGLADLPGSIELRVEAAGERAGGAHG